MKNKQTKQLEENIQTPPQKKNPQKQNKKQQQQHTIQNKQTKNNWKHWVNFNNENCANRESFAKLSIIYDCGDINIMNENNHMQKQFTRCVDTDSVKLTVWYMTDWQYFLFPLCRIVYWPWHGVIIFARKINICIISLQEVKPDANKDEHINLKVQSQVSTILNNFKLHMI